VQAVQVHADVGGLGRRVGERDRLVKGCTRLIISAKLQEQCPLGSEEVKVTREPRCQRFDHGQHGGGPADLTDPTARLSLTTGDG